MKDKFLRYVVEDMVNKTKMTNPIYIGFPLHTSLHIRAVHYFKDYEEYHPLGLGGFTEHFTSHYGVNEKDYEEIWFHFFKGVKEKYLEKYIVYPTH